MALKKVWRRSREPEKSKRASRDYDDYANESWAFLISFFRWYPDVMGDIFRSKDAEYEWDLIQRVMIRAFARNQFADITGCRSLTKTTCKMFQKCAENALWLGINSSYYGPSYEQQAELAQAAFSGIMHDYPVLASQYRINHEAASKWEVSTEYGSHITINAIRGKNIHDVTAEEYAQEENPAFDYQEYTSVVLYAVRNVYKVNGVKDPTFINFKQHTITSASSRLSHAYATRCNHLRLMLKHNPNQKAFVMDVPWEVVVLSQMRSYHWAMQRKAESTLNEWMKEMCSRYIGTSDNPAIREEVLAESRCLQLMEEHHCCKDRDNKLRPEDVIYVVGYDVAYEVAQANAKCACVVVKCTKQEEWYKKDKYLKQIVWVEDWEPTEAMIQARRLKQVWSRFCFEGSQTYIVVDGWQYGKSVIEALMQDLGDGLNPLCIYNHDQYTEYELEGALPVIYPIKAGGAGVTDPDSEIIRNAQLQWENHNVQLLIPDEHEGLNAYKTYHRIKDDYADLSIIKPYRKTKELVTQIQNLKLVPSGAGMSERRINKSYQRDSWSATKYVLRFAQILERQYLAKRPIESAWHKLIKGFRKTDDAPVNGKRKGRMVAERMGGRHFE